MSIMVLGGIVPIIPQIVKALVCAKKVFEIIEREPLIRSTLGCETKITLKDQITFNNISFRYPT